MQHEFNEAMQKEKEHFKNIKLFEQECDKNDKLIREAEKRKRAKKKAAAAE